MKCFCGLSVVCLCLVSLMITGCKDTVPMAEVRGTVKADGKPLDKIQVEFWPLSSGPRSIGVTDRDGRFELTSDNGERKGAAVGSHKVVLKDLGIVSEDIKGKSFRELEGVDITKGAKPRISTEYYDPEKTSLTQEVVAGKINDLELAVKGTQ